jgi:hypothetical protein
MKHELLNYYAERSSIFSVLKNCKNFRRINITLVVFLFLLLCLSTVNQFLLAKSIISILGCAMYLLVIVLYMIFLTRWSKKEVTDYHATIKIDIINLLKKNKVYNIEPIHEIKEGLGIEAENNKIKFPVFSSTMALLLLALFNSFLSYLLKYDYIKNFNEGIKFYETAFFVILLTFILLYFIKVSFLSMAEDIMNSRSNKAKQLSNILDNIIFELKVSSENNENM